MLAGIYVGSHVHHKRFGVGIVLYKFDLSVEVRFNDGDRYVASSELQNMGEFKTDLINKVRDHLLNYKDDCACSLYQIQCQDWWPIDEYTDFALQIINYRDNIAAEKSAHEIASAREIIRSKVITLLDEENTLRQIKLAQHQGDHGILLNTNTAKSSSEYEKNP